MQKAGKDDKKWHLLIGVCTWNRCFFIKICLSLNNKLNEFNNQSMVHRYLWLFSIFLVTGGFLPNTNARRLRLTIHRFNFWPVRKNWSAVLKVRAASIEINSDQKELSLVNTTRAPFNIFQICFDWFRNMRPCIAIEQNYFVCSVPPFWSFSLQRLVQFY